MARPTKYTPELRDQLAGYIGDGLTVRDACFGARISEDTFWRWNREKVDFAEAIKQATTAQKWSSEALARTSEYRRYIRRAHICPRKQVKHQNRTQTHFGNQKCQNRALVASESVSASATSKQAAASEQNILLTRTELPTSPFGELIPTEPYYNPKSGKVEWVERNLYDRCVLHRCELEVWKNFSDRDSM